MQSLSVRRDPMMPRRWGVFTLWHGRTAIGASCLTMYLMASTLNRVHDVGAMR